MKITCKMGKGIFLKVGTNWAKTQMLSGMDIDDVHKNKNILKVIL
jgi:hypothetical protein